MIGRYLDRGAAVLPLRYRLGQLETRHCGGGAEQQGRRADRAREPLTVDPQIVRHHHQSAVVYGDQFGAQAEREAHRTRENVPITVLVVG